ncbi:MAG: radical SAM protein [bacterium]
MLLADILATRILRPLNRPALPLLMTLNVTDRCNCRCSFCDLHSRPAATELDMPELEAVFRDPVLRRLRVLRVTGGEPFLRGDLPRLPALVASHTPARILHVTTNASMPDRVAEFLEQATITPLHTQLQISLDAEGKLHDELRGAPGLYEKVIRTLENIQPMLRRRNLSAGVNQTVSADNLDQIEPVHAIAAKFNAAHNVILAAKYHEGTDATRIGPGQNRLPFEPFLPLTRSQIETFYERVGAFSRNSGAKPGGAARTTRLRRLSDAYLREGGRNRLLKGADKPRPTCTALFNHFRLLADGSAAPCTALGESPAGNVRESSLSEIWRSPRAAGIRRKVRRCRGCWVECDISPSAFFSGDIIPYAARNLFVPGRNR